MKTDPNKMKKMKRKFQSFLLSAARENMSGLTFIQKKLKTNIEENHDELEEEDEQMVLNERQNIVLSKFMIFPDSTLKGIWDMITFVCIIY